MTITLNPNSPVKRINAGGQPNTLDALLAILDFGSVLRKQRVHLGRQNPNAFAAGVASAYDLATLQVLFLPDDAKALAITRVEARANGNSVSNGVLTANALYATPTSTHPAVTPAGNIAFLATDLYSDVDIDYEVMPGDVYEMILPVVPGTGVMAIPGTYSGTAGMGTTAAAGANLPSYVQNPIGMVQLLEAEALAGTTIGKKIVIAPGSVPGSTGQANLDITKSKVQFTVADAITQARVKFLATTQLATATADLHALLEQASQTF